jgi:hypothetical protein
VETGGGGGAELITGALVLLSIDISNVCVNWRCVLNVGGGGGTGGKLRLAALEFNGCCDSVIYLKIWLVVKLSYEEVTFVDDFWRMLVWTLYRR